MSDLMTLYIAAFHGEGDAMAAEVNVEDADGDVLVEVDDVAGMGDAAVGHLGDVHQTVLMDAEVDEGSEIGDVGDDAGQNHPLMKVVDGLNAAVEVELFYLLTGVAAGLL